MKKHKKKLFGLFGLLLVAVMTIFAAFMPTPGAIATSSVTDSIVVRVVGSTPHVEFTNEAEDATFYAPLHSFSYIYDNVKTVVISMEYTDLDGNTHDYTLETIDANYAVGSGTLDLNLSDAGYGFGEYVLRITGDRDGALLDEDSFRFYYLPFDASVTEDTDTENADLSLDYDSSANIKRFVVIVRDKDGKVVEEIPEIQVDAPATSVVIPFSDKKAPAGKYTIEITAYDTSGELYTRTLTYDYEPTKVPDTGGLLSTLNISKADYLITGLFVFFLIGIGGAVYLTKSARKNRR